MLFEVLDADKLAPLKFLGRCCWNGRVLVNDHAFGQPSGTMAGIDVQLNFANGLRHGRGDGKVDNGNGDEWKNASNGAAVDQISCPPGPG